MTENPHFEKAASWKSAADLLTFQPVKPKDTIGYELQNLRIFVRDHKLRELPERDRTLEAYYGGFVFTQCRKEPAEARRSALEVRYGASPRDGRIADHDARVYELGPEPPPDDIDGRSPSVVVWHDGEMFFLIASTKLPSEDLVRVAGSIYA